MLPTFKGKNAGIESRHVAIRFAMAPYELQGFNIRRWSERGLNYWAVSDLAADELAEFGEKFEAAMKTGTAG